MKKIILLAAFITASFHINAQVGIGTNLPTTDLEVVARTGLIANEYNGLTIPKVAVLPTVAAEIAPAGTLIYLTAVSGANPIGFYYSTGTAYVNVANAASGAFNVSGSTNTPTTTSQNVFRLGTTSLGSDVTNSQLSATSIATTSSPTRTGTFKNVNINGTTNTWALDLSNTSTTTGVKYGIDLVVSGTGNGNRYGINSVMTPSGNANRVNYGIRSRVGSTGTTLNQTNYGISSEIGTPASRGTKYAVYAVALHDTAAQTTDFSYSGWFQGDRFAIRNAAATTGYDLPTTTGTIGQVLTTTAVTGGIATTAWQNLPATPTTFTHTLVDAGVGTGNGSAGPIQISNGTYININPGGGGSNNYVLPDPALVPGRQYIIRNTNNTNNGYLVALNSTAGTKLFFEGSSSTGVQFYEVDANGNSKTVTIISDGVNYTVLRDL